MKIKITGDKDTVEVVKKYLDIYMGDYTPEQQAAATIILHMILKDEKFHKLMDAVKEVTGFKINDRNSGKVSYWKKKVKSVGKCEVCGSTERLEAHHKIPWSHSIKGRTDVANGQCLCVYCHKMMHDNVQWIEYATGRRARGERRE